MPTSPGSGASGGAADRCAVRGVHARKRVGEPRRLCSLQRDRMAALVRNRAVDGAPVGRGAERRDCSGRACAAVKKIMSAANTATRAHLALQLPLPRFAVPSLFKAYRMSQEVKHTSGPDETEALGAELAGRFTRGDVVLVSGELGSGKTTFVRGACRALGVEGPVQADLHDRPRARRVSRSRTSTFTRWARSRARTGSPGRLPHADRVAFVEWRRWPSPSWSAWSRASCSSMRAETDAA